MTFPSAVRVRPLHIGSSLSTNQQKHEQCGNKIQPTVHSDTCTGYVRRGTHVEIADAIGWNSRDILGTPADPIPKGKRNNSMPRKQAESERVVTCGLQVP